MAKRQYTIVSERDEAGDITVSYSEPITGGKPRTRPEDIYGNYVLQQHLESQKSIFVYLGVAKLEAIIELGPSENALNPFRIRVKTKVTVKDALGTEVKTHVTNIGWSGDLK